MHIINSLNFSWNHWKLVQYVVLHLSERKLVLFQNFDELATECMGEPNERKYDRICLLE